MNINPGLSSIRAIEWRDYFDSMPQLVELWKPNGIAQSLNKPCVALAAKIQLDDLGEHIVSLPIANEKWRIKHFWWSELIYEQGHPKGYKRHKITSGMLSLRARGYRLCDLSQGLIHTAFYETLHDIELQQDTFTLNYHYGKQMEFAVETKRPGVGALGLQIFDILASMAQGRNLTDHSVNVDRLNRQQGKIDAKTASANDYVGAIYDLFEEITGQSARF